jgi:uncharacterized protein (TIRG00374 family)
MKTAVRILVSSLLIGFLVFTVDLAEVMRLFTRTSVPLFLIACVWALIDRFIMIYRWALLLETNEAKLPWYRIGQIHFVSSFLGNFIPFSMAPDVLRSYSVSKHTGDFVQPLSSNIIDRLLGLTSLSLIACGALVLSLLLHPLFVSSSVAYSITGATILLSISLSLMCKRDLVEKLFSLLHSLGQNKLVTKIMEVYTGCLTYQNHKSTIAKVLGLCFVNHVGAFLMMYVIALSLNVHLSIFYFFIFIPIISFLNSLPISINAVGVSEAGFVYLFSLAGMSMPEALAMALLGRLATMIATLPGGVIYAMNGIAVRKLPA